MLQTSTPVLEGGVAASLRSVVGPDGLITDPGRLVAYESDGLTAHRRAPRAVALPRSTEEAAAVLRILAEAKLPFVGRGSGTGLSGGAVPLRDAVVVSTARMTRILDVDAENRRARVEAGVVNVRLSAMVEPRGLFYAPDPSSQTACTIGGNVAENAGGPHCLKYGVTVNHVTGLTVVLPDGEVVELGAGAGEPAGYDLVGLFVGSEGTMGLATEVEVRLSPKPEAVETLLAIYDDVEAAGRAVSAIIATGHIPAAMEMIDRNTIRAVEESIYAAGYPTDAAAALVVELDGAPGVIAEDADRVQRICEDSGARVRRAADAAERLRLWQGRKKAFGAMGRLAPDLLVQDATVPRSRLPEVLARVYEIGARYGLQVANVFHAGDGNLHPNLVFDRRDAEELERVEAASREIMAACVEAGGTITGEHGVGMDKRRYMHLVFNDDELAALCAVRRVFDPEGRANPDKIFPPGICDDDGAGEAAVADPGSGRQAGRPAPGGTAALNAAGEGEADPDRWAVQGRVPEAVLRPASVDEAAGLLRRASSEGLVVELAGAGGWLRWGRPPHRLDAVLSTRAMAGMPDHQPDDLVVSVDAGTTLDELQSVLRERGQWVPLDPPGGGAGTVGALVAGGEAGPLRLGYGTPRDHVLGVEIVAGDGRRLRFGGRVVKNVAGYDVTRLLVGSRGTLGLMTRLHLRLHPVPERDVTVAARAVEAAPLLEAIRAIRAERIEPAALELLSPEMAVRAGLAESWTLLARVHGNESAAGAAVAALERVVTGAGAAVGEEPVETWSRLGAVEAAAAVVLRVAHRPSRLAGTLDRAGLLAGGALAAHAGTGIVRAMLDDVDAAAAGPDHLAAALGELRASLADGGSVHLATATPELAARVDPFTVRDPARLMRRLKRVLDPAGVLAPGRLMDGLEGGAA